MDGIAKSQAKMSAHFRELKGERLEQTESFIRWTGTADDQGRAQYEMFCPSCHGAGELTPHKRAVPCGRCGSSGTVIGPVDCPRCGTLLPHLPAEKCVS